MELETWATILVACAPSISAICAIIGGLISVLRATKKNNENTKIELAKATERLQKAYDDIAKMQTQIESISNYLIKQKEKRR